MKCPVCAKDSNVTIGQRVYCTSCGAVVQDNTPATAPAPAASAQVAASPSKPPVPPATTVQATPSPVAKPPAAPGRLTDISKGSGEPLALNQPTATPAAPRPVVTPIGGGRRLQDVVVPVAAKRPAGEYHAQPTAPTTPTVVTPPPITTPPTPASEPPLTPPPAPAAITPPTAASEPPPLPAPAAKQEVLVPVTEHTSTPLPTATPPPPPSAADQKVGEQLAVAVTIPKSQQISKFQASTEPAPTIPAISAKSVTPAPVAVETPAATPGPELPPAVATQHEALASLIAPGAPAATDQTRSKAFDLAMQTSAPKPARKPNLAATAGATLAIIVMGSYIWLQNYPRLQLSVIAGKAGFTASLPGYVPPSYNLHGGVAYAAGQVTLHYSAPGLAGFSISQHLTSWDAASLLDNYVTKQATAYTAVQSQGLTIYLYGKGEAAWVNHGLWYSITGNTNLSRSQILDIAYSL